MIGTLPKVIKQRFIKQKFINQENSNNQITKKIDNFSNATKVALPSYF